jgi:hypothetical protein
VEDGWFVRTYFAGAIEEMRMEDRKEAVKYK